jgi:SAM-dependent methyltransferase
MAKHEMSSARSAALARLYDVDLIEDPGDVELYMALAARTGGPVLEIAAGSGRVAVPLAAAGFEVTAVDSDPAMLARAAVAARAAGPDVEGRLRLVEADLIGLELPAGQEYRLSILSLNSLLLMATIDDQKRALETMARHLTPGGLAVVDVWLPNGRELAGYDGRISLEYVRTDPETGNEIVKMAAAQHEPATGSVELSMVYQEVDQGGVSRTWTKVDRLRLLDAGALAFLAESAGLEVETVASDYDLDPLGPHDERAILIARRRDRLAPRD